MRAAWQRRSLRTSVESRRRTVHASADAVPGDHARLLPPALAQRRNAAPSEIGDRSIRFPASFGERVSVVHATLINAVRVARPSSSRAVLDPTLIGLPAATIVSYSLGLCAVDMSPTQNACTHDVLGATLQVTPVIGRVVTSSEVSDIECDTRSVSISDRQRDAVLGDCSVRSQHSGLIKPMLAASSVGGLTSVSMVVVSSGPVVGTASISLVGHVILTPSMCSGLANIGHSEFVKQSAVVRGAPAKPIGCARLALGQLGSGGSHFTTSR